MAGLRSLTDEVIEGMVHVDVFGIAQRDHLVALGYSQKSAEIAGVDVMAGRPQWNGGMVGRTLAGLSVP